MVTVETANENVIWSEMDGEVILLDTASGEFYSLNETATEAWQGLERGETLDQIAASFADKYGVPAAQAQADVAELIAELRALGLTR